MDGTGPSGTEVISAKQKWQQFKRHKFRVCVKTRLPDQRFASLAECVPSAIPALHVTNLAKLPRVANPRSH